MSEQTRQHYLKQMGVTLWYSRCELPGAAESPEFLFGANLDGADESNAHVQNNLADKDAGAVTPKSAADILNSLSPKQDAVVIDTASPDLVSDSTRSASSVIGSGLKAETMSLGVADKSDASILAAKSNLNETEPLPGAVELDSRVATPLANLEAIELMLWVGRKNWFISDSDSEYPEQLKRQLLLNIASAMGESVESTQVLCFRWPFFGNKQLPGNDAVSMLSLLKEWLGERLSSDGLTGFLMGEKVAALLLQAPSTLGGGDVSMLDISDDRDIKVITTLPLNDLLRESLNKRVVWQHLSPYLVK